MDYERKYKLALERAKKLYEQGTITESLGYVFPELKEKESEDERIKREILELVSITGNGNQYEEIKDWLEKQGEKKHIINVPPREVILSIWDLGNEWKELTNGSISTEYGTQLDYIQKHWHESEYYLKEKQDEKDPCIGCTNDKGCVTCENGNLKEIKVEPKFKVGDWVVNSVCFPMQIASIKDGMYIFTKGDTMSVLFIDGNFHLWTIHDAMVGDVLVHNDCPFIFMGIKDNLVQALDENLYDSTNPVNFGELRIDNDYHLATKEQRKFLFQKIRDKGYEWDAEKKELKNKESEDDRMRKNLYKCLRYYVPDDIAEEYIKWLEKQGNGKSVNIDIESLYTIQV